MYKYIETYVTEKKRDGNKRKEKKRTKEGRRNSRSRKRRALRFSVCV